jgi:hypothetical protein
MKKAYNDNSLKVSDWSTKKLKEEYKAIWESVCIIECFGVKDMLLLGLIEQELYNRGIEVIENKNITFAKA